MIHGLSRRIARFKDRQTPTGVAAVLDAVLEYWAQLWSGTSGAHHSLFSAALETLLQRPVYHGGTQAASDEQAEFVLDAIAAITDGYAAIPGPCSGFLRVVLLPREPMRRFPRYLDVLYKGRWGELYDALGEPAAPGIDVWNGHMQHLRQVVPPEKLVFFDVKEGWGPLCEALGCAVPEGVEFPRINDGVAIESFAREQITKGLGDVFGVAK
ncbi:hypothetical protein GGR56DRAFT_679172 [Xylariaceae sp. FL0804]|nr:hypothetical protein GGR56DRAFT_679172 [Xylariaceae sp. FL0804]